MCWRLTTSWFGLLRQVPLLVTFCTSLVYMNLGNNTSGLQSMGLQRVRHDWTAVCTRARAHTHLFIYQMLIRTVSLETIPGATVTEADCWQEIARWLEAAHDKMEQRSRVETGRSRGHVLKSWGASFKGTGWEQNPSWCRNPPDGLLFDAPGHLLSM